MIKPCFVAARVTGTGCALPERRLTNRDLEQMVQTNDDWISSRTGIRERRIAGPDDTTASLATVAAQRALSDAGLDAADVGLLIIATLTPDTPTPSTACLVQNRLGIPCHAGAFDLNAACSGFLYGLATATQFIQTGVCRHAVVVGAETLTRFVDYTDRGTCILFGDVLCRGAVCVRRRGGGYSRLSAWSRWSGSTAHPDTRRGLAPPSKRLQLSPNECTA